MNFVKYNYSSNPIDEASSACIALKTNQVETLCVYQILSCLVQQKNIMPIPFPLSFMYYNMTLGLSLFISHSSISFVAYKSLF